MKSIKFNKRLGSASFLFLSAVCGFTGSSIASAVGEEDYLKGNLAEDDLENENVDGLDDVQAGNDNKVGSEELPNGDTGVLSKEEQDNKKQNNKEYVYTKDGNADDEKTSFRALKEIAQQAKALMKRYGESVALQAEVLRKRIWELLAGLGIVTGAASAGLYFYKKSRSSPSGKEKGTNNEVKVPLMDKRELDKNIKKLEDENKKLEDVKKQLENTIKKNEEKKDDLVEKNKIY